MLRRDIERLETLADRRRVSRAVGPQPQWAFCLLQRWGRFRPLTEVGMNNIIYIVGLVVVVLAVLSFFGLR